MTCGATLSASGAGPDRWAEAMTPRGLPLLKWCLARIFHTPIENSSARRVGARGLQSPNHNPCRPRALTRRSKCEMFGLALAVMAVLSLSGCKKKEASVQSTPEAAPAAPAAVSAPSSAPAPARRTVTEAMTQSDQALKARDYEKAMDALLQAQFAGQIKTEAESWEYNRRMTALQAELSKAAASGDARAKAAIDMLRRSHSVR